jgi:glycosyltransferase involved in cell wall biosynthesis
MAGGEVEDQRPAEERGMSSPRELEISTAPASGGRPRVLIVLPCYNEERSIGSVLAEIAALGRGYDTLVVDDGSSDATHELARRKSACVRLVSNLGIGGAVQTGIKYAHRHCYDFCVQIDGDGQHPPDQVERLLSAYDREPANMVIGSRYLSGSAFRSTWLRRLGSGVIARAIGLVFGRSGITDPTSGLRLMDRRAIAFFSQSYPYDFPEPISVAWALRAGLSVRETPVEMRAREHGRSSIMGLMPLAYMVRVLGYVALARFRV